MKLVMVGDVSHEIKVTRLKAALWGVRCFTNTTLNQEIRVKSQQDIGVAVSEMLREEVKCGNFSDMAESARKRACEPNRIRKYSLPVQHIVIK